MGAPSRLYASLNLTGDVSRTTASEYLRAIELYEGVAFEGAIYRCRDAISVPCCR